VFYLSTSSTLVLYLGALMKPDRVEHFSMFHSMAKVQKLSTIVRLG